MGAILKAILLLFAHKAKCLDTNLANILLLNIDEDEGDAEIQADTNEEESATDAQHFHSGSLCSVCSICEVKS